MTASSLSAVSLAMILSLAVPRFASPAELRLTFQNGRVTLVARDASVRDVLAEWERVGGTRIVNRDAVPEALLTLDLADVPEIRALAIILQQAAGYFASERTTAADASSRFTRIVIMPGVERSAVVPPAGAQPSGTSAGSRAEQGLRVQRRTMPDGRVAGVVEDPARLVETPVVVEDDEIPELPLVEEPVNRARPLPPGAAPVPADATQAPTRVSPTVPATAGAPGKVVPGSKPELVPYRPQELPPTPPPPIKPPDI